jgi:uncharacterized protein
MQCPRCQTVLQISERQGVEIDTCPSCRGVWLDRGELDKIAERMAQYEARAFRRGDDDDDDDDDRRRYAPPPPPGQPYGQPYPQQYDDRHYKQHKKKSFWSELFD